MPAHSRRLTAFLVAMALLVVTPLAVIAADKFDDVPDSNIFHDDIAWLADADVTRGCNPPDNTQFCPSDNVTREQMAAFMKRLAQNQVVDAGWLEGRTAEQIVSGFADSGPTGNVETIDGVAMLEQLEIEAPADGYLQILGSASIISAGGSTMLVWIQVDNDTCDNTPSNIGSVGFGYGSHAGNANDSSASSAFAEGTVAVTEGSHIVTLCGNLYVGGPANLYGPSIGATFLSNATVSPGLHSGSLEGLPGLK